MRSRKRKPNKQDGNTDQNALVGEWEIERGLSRLNQVYTADVENPDPTLAITPAEWRNRAKQAQTVGNGAKAQRCLENAAIASNKLPRNALPSQADAEQAIHLFQSWLPRRSPRLRKGTTPADHIRYHTAKNKVLFYPACRFDWYPLYRFQHCDTFIYCDYGVSVADFADQIAFGNIPHAQDRLVVEAIYPIPQGLLDVLQEPSAMPLNPPNVVQRVVPWGRLVFLTSRVSGRKPRPLKLWYFGMDGVTLYRNLFLRKKWAPEFLCIKNCGFGYGNGWTDFRVWQNPLGRMIDQNPKMPRFLVVDEEHHVRGYNWPWNVLWLTIDNWEGAGRPVHIYHRPEIQPTDWDRRGIYLD